MILRTHSSRVPSTSLFITASVTLPNHSFTLVGVEVGRHLRAEAEEHSPVAVVDRSAVQVVDPLVGNTEHMLVLAIP